VVTWKSQIDERDNDDAVINGPPRFRAAAHHFLHASRAGVLKMASGG